MGESIEMMLNKIAFVSLILMSVSLLSCAAETQPAENSAKSPGQAVAAPQTAAVPESEWERILKEARKEGKVVLYGGTSAARLKDMATKLIKDKFGLDLEVVSGRAQELETKIFAERDRGIYTADVYTGGVSAVYRLKARGVIAPMEPMLKLPEVLDKSKWLDGRLPWGDDDKTTFIWAAFPHLLVAVNNSAVQPAETKSYKDFLDPRWKGKILMNDPTIAGGAQLGFTGSIYNSILDAGYYRQLAREQQITIIRDQHLQLVWLAAGKYSVLFLPSSATVGDFMHNGAPVSWITPKEGVMLSGAGGGWGMVNKAPHPNAAIVFTNWFLSREGQQIIQDATDKQSQRVDIPTDKLTDVRQTGVKYFPDPTNLEPFVLYEYDKYNGLAKDIFGSLLR